MQQQEVLWRLEDQVNPEHTALLVIDPQNDFCANDGALIRIMGWDPSRIQGSVPRLNRFIEKVRDAQLTVVWTKSIVDPIRSKPSYKARGFMQEAKSKLIEPVKEATDGSEWYSDVLKPLDNEYVITKYHYDAFADTDLDLLLRGRGIKTLLLNKLIMMTLLNDHAIFKNQNTVSLFNGTETVGDDDRGAAFKEFF